MDDEQHFPPGAEPVKTADELAAESEAAKAAEEQAAAEAAEKTKADEAAAAETDAKDKAEADAKVTEEADKTLPKKWSIYDDLKDRKQEAKDAKEAAATEKARADAAETKAAELEALLAGKDKAATPAEEKKADDDLKAYAEKHSLDADGLEELAGILAKRLPMPEGLSPEEVKAFRETQAATQRQSEDNAVFAEAPKVKEQLSVSDDAELQTVMKEIVKLSHTEAFHDKEVEYIVWKNREALSKMVSPKKPSFEAGSTGPEGQAENIDFSSGKVTPEQAQKAMESPKSSYEIRSAK